jgi:hypothetical protein
MTKVICKRVLYDCFPFNSIKKLHSIFLLISIEILYKPSSFVNGVGDLYNIYENWMLLTLKERSNHVNKPHEKYKPLFNFTGLYK